MTSRTLRRGLSLLTSFTEDPVEVLVKVQDRLTEGREPNTPDYCVDADWEPRLHGLLHAPWPCPSHPEFERLWNDVMERLRGLGIGVGRGAFGGWGDADPAFARAVWCIARHTSPAVIVETGVARGLTSRFLLEALERNGHGALWSIDLPPPLDRELHKQIGVAVPRECRHRWTYVRGSSRRRLAELLGRVGTVDMFVHDSRHTTRNVRFELDHVCGSMQPGGVFAIDDIDLNDGFRSFRSSYPARHALVCRAEPLKPDPARQNGVGLFGIMLA
jgi:Methyltransferase domain